MPLPAWHEEEITREHKREQFNCGVSSLNEYLQRHARQNHDSDVAKTFVVVPDDEPGRILGYYSLSNASIEYQNVPAHLTKHFPQYPIPAVRLARLARDVSCRGMGLGPQLLLCAGERALEATRSSGAVMLLIDAINEQAAAWYKANDAEPLRDEPLTLVIPLASIRKTITEIRAQQATTIAPALPSK